MRNELPKTVPAFRKWLVAEIADIDRHLAYEDDPRSYIGEENYRDAANTVREACDIALRFGLPELDQKFRVTNAVLSFGQAKTILSECLAATAAKQKSGGDSRFLTVPEAAVEMGISEATLRTLCKNRKIDHKREGTRGRGSKGTILIEQQVIEAYNARQCISRVVPNEPTLPVLRKKSQFSSPHLEPHKWR